MSKIASKSDLIRLRVKELFIRPAIESGAQSVSVKVRDVLTAMNRDDVHASRTPMICQALTGNKILEENGLTIERIDGPPSKQSRTVVVHYTVNPSVQRPAVSRENDPAKPAETPAEWAARVTSGLAGLLKDEIAAYGGTEAFMKWVRAEDHEA